MLPRTQSDYPVPSASNPGYPTLPPPVELGFATDPGLSGKPNQDYYGIIDTAYAIGQSTATKIPVLAAVIADGVSNVGNSEVAGQVAVETVRRVLAENEHVPVVARLNAAMARANRDIYELIKRDAQYDGSATTLTVAAVADDQLFVAHIGDSRVYLLRNRQLHQLTIDHRWGQEAVDAGEMTPEQAAQHPDRNIVSRLLGPLSDVEIDNTIIDIFQTQPSTAAFQRYPRVDRMWLQPGDTILLCSDGLSDVLPHNQIEATLNRMPIQPAVDRLIELTKSVGAPDNVTIIGIRFPLQQPQPSNELPEWYQLKPHETTAAPGVTPTRQPIGLMRTIVAGLSLLLAALIVGFVLARWVLPALQTEPTTGIPEPTTELVAEAQPNEPTNTAVPSAPASAAVVTDTSVPPATEPAATAAVLVEALPTLPPDQATVAPSVAPSATEPAVISAAPTTAPTEPPTVVPTEPPTEPPTVPPATPTSEPPTVQPPTAEPPTIEPPTAEPPTVEPPTAAPPTSAPVTVDRQLLLLTVEPATGATRNGAITFSWQPGFELAANEAFELLIWPVGQDREKTARAWGGISTETRRTINFDNLGIPYGQYQWGVRLVEVEPYRSIFYLGPDYRIDYVR